jgi:predicted transporter
MLALERGRTVPLVVRLGLAGIVFGIVADLVTHLSFADADATGGHTPAQLSAHAIVFAGMVLVLAGVLVDAARQSTARRPTPGNQPPTGDA